MKDVSAAKSDKILSQYPELKELKENIDLKTKLDNQESMIAKKKIKI